MEEIMIVIKDLKTSCFHFDWTRFVDKNLKYETELIIKSNASLAENKAKNKIKELLFKYKPGNNI